MKQMTSVVTLLAITVWVSANIFGIRPLKLFASDWIQSTGVQFDYSIEYPKNWVFREYTDGFKNKRHLVATISNPSRYDKSLFSVEIHHHPAFKGNIQDIADWGATLILADVTFGDIRDEMINEQVYLRRTYFTDKLAYEDVYIQGDNGAFVITFRVRPSAYSEWIDEFDRMVIGFEPS